MKTKNPHSQTGNGKKTSTTAKNLHQKRNNYE